MADLGEGRRGLASHALRRRVRCLQLRVRGLEVEQFAEEQVVCRAGDVWGVEKAVPARAIFQPVPKREWCVRDRIPLRNVTLFSGEDAIGKSIVLLHLAVAHVLGRNWFGSMPEPGPALTHLLRVILGGDLLDKTDDPAS
jgi:hypothetical protein